MSAALTQALAALATARAEHAAALRVYNRAFDAFQAQMADVRETIRALGVALNQAEATARQAALDAYAADPSTKTPAAGVTIKVEQVATVDTPAALTWARTAMPTLITETLDTATLGKIAAATPLPFVTFTPTPKATLAKDLSGYLTPETSNV